MTASPKRPKEIGEIACHLAIDYIKSNFRSVIQPRSSSVTIQTVFSKHFVPFAGDWILNNHMFAKRLNTRQMIQHTSGDLNATSSCTSFEIVILNSDVDFPFSTQIFSDHWAGPMLLFKNWQFREIIIHSKVKYTLSRLVNNWTIGVFIELKISNFTTAQFLIICWMKGINMYFLIMT